MTPPTEELADLEDFDPTALVGDSVVPQSVCNLVLGLSLFHVSFKDSIFAYDYLTSTKPDGEFEYTPAWGEYCGREQHVARYQIGLIHELLKMLEKHKKDLSDRSLLEAVRRLDRRAREAWDTLCDVVVSKNLRSPLAKNFHGVRNKLAFHFDTKALFASYRSRFLITSASERPMVSRGRTMAGTRFYFADAAAQDFLNVQFGGDRTDMTAEELSSMIHQVNFAILSLVQRFINGRSPFRRLQEGRS